MITQQEVIWTQFCLVQALPTIVFLGPHEITLAHVLRCSIAANPFQVMETTIGAIFVCYKNVLMGFQDNVPSPNATDLAACRLQQTIPEIQGSCNQLSIHCRSAGFAYGVALPGCINDLTLKNLLPKYDAIKANPGLVLACANAKYTLRNFSASCSHVFQKCQEISGGNNSTGQTQHSYFCQCRKCNTSYHFAQQTYCSSFQGPRSLASFGPDIVQQQRD